MPRLCNSLQARVSWARLHICLLLKTDKPSHNDAAVAGCSRKLSKHVSSQTSTGAGPRPGCKLRGAVVAVSV